MKMERRYPNGYDEHYYCDITRFLDQVRADKYNKHYLYILENESINGQCISIRFPGRTIGGLWVNEDGVIEKICIDYDLVGLYGADINEKMQQFMGERIEIS